MFNSNVFRALCIYMLLWPTVVGWAYTIAHISPRGLSIYLLDYAIGLVTVLLVLIGLFSRDRSQPVTIEFGRWRWVALLLFLISATLGPWLAAPEPSFAYLRLLMLLPFVLCGFAAYLWFQTLGPISLIQIALAFSGSVFLHAMFVMPFLQPYIDTDTANLSWATGMVPFFNVRRYTNYFAIAIPVMTGVCIWLRNERGRTLADPLKWPALATLALCMLWALLFWTGSRAPILAISSAISTMMVMSRAHRTPLLKITSISVLLGSVISLFLPNPTNEFGFWSRIVDSNKYQTMDKIGSGRSVLWSEAWRLFLENPIFGNGHAQLMLQQSVPERVRLATPHNFPLEMLNDFGIVGGIAIMALIYGGMIKMMLKARKEDVTALSLIGLLAMLTITFQSFFDGNITPFTSTILFAIFWAWTAASLRLKPSTHHHVS